MIKQEDKSNTLVIINDIYKYNINDMEILVKIKRLDEPLIWFEYIKVHPLILNIDKHYCVETNESWEYINKFNLIYTKINE